MLDRGAADAVDGRSGRRANVFLGAVLHIGGSSFPVRIRNLSPSGALIDGADVPNGGDAVRLQRGPHSVVARVVWSSRDACGLRFSSIVPVQEWISYGSGHRGQQGVDEKVASVRAGAWSGFADAATSAPAVDCMEAADQLDVIGEYIDGIAEELSSIPAVVEKATFVLQRLDMARQKLVDLAATIRGDGC